MAGIAGDDCQIGARGLVRFRAALLPIPESSEGNVKAGSEFLLRQFEGTADDFRLGGRFILLRSAAVSG